MSLDFDKQKYLDVAKSQGVHAAITLLHKDMERVEYQSFEGEMKDEGRLHRLHDQMRGFSRELWGLALDKGDRVG
jgi:hypothetical protein